jgi:stage III sporulation protein AD
MEIFKIAAIGVIAALMIVFLRESKPELALIVSLAAGALILIFVVDYLVQAFQVFEVLMEKSGIDKDLIGAIIKIVGIGYITEFSANICLDSNNKALADKIQFGGKVLILVISLPLLNAMIDIILSLLQ